VITPQQRYRQGIEGIWEKVDQLPKGQDQVVMSQLWEFGKTSAIPTPARFPALAASSPNRGYASIWLLDKVMRKIQVMVFLTAGHSTDEQSLISRN
jgi:hypothetical protein